MHQANNQSGAVRSHYDERGDRTKASLVLVFGAGGFDDLIALREKDFHIIRIGVYGHEPCEVAKAKRGLLQGLSLRGNESTTRQ